MTGAVKFTTGVDSPVGPLVLVSDGTALTALLFADPGGAMRVAAGCVPRDDAPPFPQARRELREYFAGSRTSFTIPLAPQGTPFQLRVWEALRQIPCGATATYGEVARGIGSPRATRAVGAANARNPLAILIPCHRVVAAAGALGGYAGGEIRKRLLLQIEAAPRPAGQGREKKKGEAARRAASPLSVAVVS